MTVYLRRTRLGIRRVPDRCPRHVSYKAWRGIFLARDFEISEISRISLCTARQISDPVSKIEPEKPVFVDNFRQM